MVKDFSYTSNSGTKDRKVFVIRENKHYIEGLDLNLLSPADASTITTMYKDFVPVKDSIGTKVTLPNYDMAWNKAYRTFAKCSINK